MNPIQITNNHQWPLLSPGFVFQQLIHLSANATECSAEVSPWRKTFLYFIIDHFIVPSCNQHIDILLSFLWLWALEISPFALDKWRKGTSHFIYVYDCLRSTWVCKNGQHELCKHSAYFFILRLVLFNRCRFKVFVGIAHFAKVSWDNGATETALKFAENVLGQLHSSIKWSFSKGFLNYLLDFDRFAIFAFLLKRGD